MGDAVTLLLRLLGTLLLLLAGMGGGFAAAARAENSRRQLHSFARLLTYLAELLDAQALTGPELLRRAAQDPAFAVFCPAPRERLSVCARITSSPSSSPPTAPISISSTVCAAWDLSSSSSAMSRFSSSGTVEPSHMCDWKVGS